jgi:hypothetical protein
MEELPMKSGLRGAARLCSGVLLALSVGAAQGAPITWNFKALLTDVSPGGNDPLGIDGEFLELQISYDDANTWVLGTDDRLYFASDSATATIGSHTVTFLSPTPTAYFGGGSTPASVVEAVSNSSFVDFVIDGVNTQTFGFQGETAAIPGEGDNLLSAHLMKPGTLLASASISSCVGTGGPFDCDYSLKAVPVPPAIWLFGSGLLGLIGLGRRLAG